MGRDYPGLYPVGKTMALRRMLLRAEGDASFYQALADRCRSAAERTRPEFEVAAWRRLLKELSS